MGWGRWMKLFYGAAAAASLVALAVPAAAQDLKLVAQCSQPQGSAALPLPIPPPPPAPPKDGGPSVTPTPPPPPPPAPTATTISCELRATDFVAFKSVKASVKGRSDALDVAWDPFDPRTKTLAALFMMQTTEPLRGSTLGKISSDVADITQSRDGKRKFAAYSYANDLNKLAEFGASAGDFDRAVRSLKPIATTTQLYKTALDAIAVLAKEPADRKALVILGDGTTDDQNYKAEDVIKAANDAGVVIHVLGYIDDVRSGRPDFQNLSRLARDTGGFQAELKPRAKGLPADATTGRFIGEVMENGGTAKITVKEPGGPTTINIAADFTNGRFASIEHTANIPVPVAPLAPPVTIGEDVKPKPEPGFFSGIASWVQRNAVVSFAIGAAMGLGLIGLYLAMTGSQAGKSAPITDPQGRPVVYGWLEMLDGNASRYPLRTTNVRIGRHHDNDVCLRNDSISRRHAVLHFNSENRRFVITDLGGGNGVIVNKSRYTSRELNDGDMVELGEVRLRFRTNMELMG